MKKNLLLFLISLLVFQLQSQAQGIHSFSGAEMSNFGPVSLITPTGQSWSTNRSSVPGYISVMTGGSLTGASDNANVDGYVKKYGNEAFTFPVGSGTELRNVSMSAPANASAAFAAAWIDGDPRIINDPTTPNDGLHTINSLGTGILTVRPVGQWDWQDFNNTGAGLIITVSIPDMTHFALAANLRLVGWDGSVWRNLSAGATASGNTAGSTLSGTMINGITAIGIGSTEVALDTKLSGFSLNGRNCRARLNWTTNSETGIASFDVEQSKDGINYTKIGTVAATHPAGGDYNFSTDQDLSATYYYRLKLVSTNGLFEYSLVQRLVINCGTDKAFVLLYPNPSSRGIAEVTLRFKTPYRGNGMVWITDNMGQRFLNYPIVLTDGENVFTLNTRALAAGTYYVKILTADGTSIDDTQKLIKQ